MTVSIGRRELLAALGGAAAAWSFAARAQQPATPLVGFLDPRSPDVVRDRLRAFRQGLKETGYVEGENVTIAYRFAENQIDRLHDLAADLVRRQVALIATVAEEAAFVAKQRQRRFRFFSLSAETRSAWVWSPASPTRAAT